MSGGAGSILAMIHSLKANQKKLKSNKENPLGKRRTYLSGDKKWVEDVQLSPEEKEALLRSILEERLKQRKKEVRLLVISLVCGLIGFIAILKIWIL